MIDEKKKKEKRTTAIELLKIFHFLYIQKVVLQISSSRLVDRLS